MSSEIDKEPRPPMMAERDTCEHFYASHLRGGVKIHVRVCVLCKTIDFDDLNEQAAEIERAGYAQAVEALRSDRAYKRYAVEGFRVLFGRTDLSVDETMDEINALRRKYGLRDR